MAPPGRRGGCSARARLMSPLAPRRSMCTLPPRRRRQMLIWPSRASHSGHGRCRATGCLAFGLGASLSVAASGVTASHHNTTRPTDESTPRWYDRSRLPRRVTTPWFDGGTLVKNGQIMTGHPPRRIAAMQHDFCNFCWLMQLKGHPICMMIAALPMEPSAMRPEDFMPKTRLPMH